jgi:hypothetical protein
MQPYCRQDRWIVRRELAGLQWALNHTTRMLRPLMAEDPLPRRLPTVRRRPAPHFRRRRSF